ncbi:MAG: protein kinase domain-containing protein [Phycisphaerales bacterium]
MSTDQPADVASLIQRFFQSRAQGRRTSIDEVLVESGVHPDPRLRTRLISDISERLREGKDDWRGEYPTDSGLPVLPDIPGYDLIEEIGRGGMGVVYEAYQRSTCRRVAVKLMSAQTAADDAARRRFEREVELVARLQHPGIVSVLDSGVHADHPYCIQEFVDGVTLDVFLATVDGSADRVEARRLDTTLRLLIDICDAVEYAYQRGVLHRDLKPSNILVDRRSSPRIVDFGLARDIDPTSSKWRDYTLWAPGELLGTLAYMAPEQTRGALGEVSIRSDIYSLGAIGYEALTRRLPCSIEGTLPEFLQRLEHHEPPAPSSITRGLSADIDAVVLRALDKNPSRRFASAAEFRDDLKRIVLHEPVHSRPIGPVVRTARWARRRPAHAALLVTLLSLVSVVAGISIWMGVRSAATAQAVERDLRDVAQFQQRSLWVEAGASLERAKGRLGDGAAANLRFRIDEAARNLRLVALLDEIRLSRADFVKTDNPGSDADSEYREAFADLNLTEPRVDTALISETIRNSTVRDPIISGLMDWASATSDTALSERVQDVVRRVNPVAWEEHVRDPDAWSTPAGLAEWIRSVSLTGQPVHKLTAMSHRVADAGGDAVAFLKRVQREHPDDLWANLELSIALRSKPAEAIGFARAAVALRPSSAVVHNNLGLFLAESGKMDEAVGYFEEAVRLNDHPGGHINLGYVAIKQGNLATAIEHFEKALKKGVKNPFLHNGYGIALKAQGRLDDAIGQFERALAIDPKLPVVHCNLAQSLIDAGRVDEAIDHYEAATRLDSADIVTQAKLWALLARQGRLEDAHAGWQRTVATNPSQHTAWFGYAELCLFLGREEEYRTVRQELLARFGSTSDPVVAERTGRSCLLLPATDDELLQAVELCDRSIADTTFREAATYRPYFLFAKGLAAYRLGRIDETITLMEGDASTVLGPAPRLLLAMAQQRKGLHAEAVRSLAAANSSFNWSTAQATDQEKWMFHILRREAEALIATGFDQ